MKPVAGTAASRRPATWAAGQRRPENNSASRIRSCPKLPDLAPSVAKIGSECKFFRKIRLIGRFGRIILGGNREDALMSKAKPARRRSGAGYSIPAAAEE